jgi:N-acetylglucosamine-6-sulfatase
VPEGKTRNQMVLNNDLAPTFADLAGAKTPAFVDGRSLVPLLTNDPPPPKDWRKRFVVESVAERSGEAQPPFINESTIAPLLTGDPLPKNWRRSSADSAQSSEEWGRPWMKALRTKDYLYVEYKTGEHELYDLRKDPYELHNEYASAPPDLKRRLQAQLDALRKCTAAGCRAAEGGQPDSSQPGAGQPGNR